MRSFLLHGSRIAVEQSDRQLTYDELRAAASRITDILLARPVPQQSVVGIFLDEKIDMISHLIGVANAGCVFVLLDPRLPVERLSYLVKDLSLSVVFSSSRRVGQLTEAGMSSSQIIVPEQAAGTFGADPVLSLPVYDKEDSLYIYYTSGSTGRPKGIVGRNKSLLQFIQWEISAFELGEEIRVSQLISPYFDAFLRDIFVPLFAGGTICIPHSDKEILEPDQLAGWIDSARVTLIHCVPSVFRILGGAALKPDDLGSLRYILLSGEKLVPRELAGWYAIFGPRIQLVNFYGATETTLIRAWYKIRPTDVSLVRIPIGQPIADTGLLVLNEELRPCGKLAPGDLYIASAFLTKGYLHDETLNKEKFVLLFPGTDREIMAFKTGDKARMLADGNIDLLGREDRQIKLRGIRIEPEEIENVLLASKLVTHVVVAKRPADNGDETLAAYVITREPGSSTPEELSAYLKERLPDYMIPASIFLLTAFPLLDNGKINYSELLKTTALVSVKAPASPLEEQLLSIWKEVLGDKPISTEDSFHSIGGSSISMMKLIGKIYKIFHVRVALGDLFNNLTIKKQAELISRAGRDQRLTIGKAPVREGYPLTSAQERIYYNYEWNKNSVAYNLPMAWELGPEADEGKIIKSIQALVRQHTSLRTSIRVAYGTLVQVIGDGSEVKVAKLVTKNDDWQTVITAFVQPFDPSATSLFRCAIATNGDGRRLLLMDVHHLVCDGMSQAILVKDFLAFYEGREVKPLAIQYTDYAVWESVYRQTEDYTRHREFWLSQLEGRIPVLALPVLAVRELKESYEGGTIHFTIEKRRLNNLQQLFREEGITPFAGWLTLYFLFLSQLSGQDDILVGINTTGRIQTELEGVTGMFAKTLPLRCRRDAGSGFRKLAKAIHSYVIRAVANQLYDLAHILRDLNYNSEEPIKSLFDVMFVYLDFGQTNDLSEHPAFSARQPDNESAKFPLTLFANEEQDVFGFRLEYADRYFSASDAQLLVDSFIAMVLSVQDSPDEEDSAFYTSSSPSLATENISFNL